MNVLAAAADNKGVGQVDFSLNGAPASASDTVSADGWSAAWDTTKVTNGAYQLTATAVGTIGQRTSRTVSVTVANPAPVPAPTITTVSPSLSRQSTTVSVTITGTGFVGGTRLDLINGLGTKPVVSGVTVKSPTSIVATFKVGKNPGTRVDRPWDVVVTNPDGSRP